MCAECVSPNLTFDSFKSVTLWKHSFVAVWLESRAVRAASPAEPHTGHVYFVDLKDPLLIIHHRRSTVNTTDCLVCHTARYLRVVYSWRCGCVFLSALRFNSEAPVVFSFCRVECFVSAGEDTSLSVVRANAASSLVHSTFFTSPDNIAHRLSTTTTTNRLGRYSARTHVCKTHFHVVAVSVHSR